MRSRREKPWPISDGWGDRLTVFYCSYDANRQFPAGVMIFTVTDWGRGEDDIWSRARGMVASHNITKLVRVGTTSQDVSQECYANLQSAEMRWHGITELLGGSQ